MEVMVEWVWSDMVEAKWKMHAYYLSRGKFEIEALFAELCVMRSMIGVMTHAMNLAAAEFDELILDFVGGKKFYC